MKNFNWHEETAREWSNRAEKWSMESKRMWEEGSRKEVLPFLKSRLTDSMAILDIGCGDGYASCKMAKEGYQVTGIDLSTEMIQRAKEASEGLPVTFLQEDVASMSFADASFDAALVINVIEWTSSPLAVIREMNRVLKSEGIIVAGVLGPTAMPRVHSYQRFYNQPTICNTMMPWEFNQLMKENGFILLDSYPVYKQEVSMENVHSLPVVLQQALSFMWVFAFQKSAEKANNLG